MCLLMNFTHISMFQEVNLKCTEVYTESEAVKKIQKSSLWQNQFKYFFCHSSQDNAGILPNNLRSSFF